MASSFVTYMTNEIRKNESLLATQTPTLVTDHLKFCICYISELVKELLGNTSIFYYDPELGVNVITWEPLLAGNK